jgi:hypothetical protein
MRSAAFRARSTAERAARSRRSADCVRLGVRGARVSVTARIEAFRTGGGRLGGTERTTGSKSRGTVDGRLGGT